MSGAWLILRPRRIKRKRGFSSLIELAAGGIRSSVALHIMTLERSPLGCTVSASGNGSVVNDSIVNRPCARCLGTLPIEHVEGR